jgi:hypothetical protein
MTTLRDLVLEIQQGAVVEEIARFYDQRETQWLPDAVADVLGQLQNLAPDLAGSPYQLSIELMPPADPKDQPFWDVSCTKEDDPDRCGLELSPWEEWLALRVPQEKFQSILRKHGVIATLHREKGNDIAAACGQSRLQSKRGERASHS